MARKRGRESGDEGDETHRALPPAMRNLTSTDASVPAPAPLATSSSQPLALPQQTLARTKSTPGNNHANPSNATRPANPQPSPHPQQQYAPIFLPSDTEFTDAINAALSTLPTPTDPSAANSSPDSGTAFYPLAYLDLTANTTTEQRTIIHSQETLTPSFKLHLDRARSNLYAADTAGIDARRQQVMRHRTQYEQQRHAAARAQWQAKRADDQRQQDEALQAQLAQQRQRGEAARRQAAQAAAEEQLRLQEEARCAEDDRAAAAARAEEIDRYAAFVAREAAQQNREAWIRNNRE